MIGRKTKLRQELYMIDDEDEDEAVASTSMRLIEFSIFIEHASTSIYFFS